MKDFLLITQSKIAEVTAIPYVDENWGQLDEYGSNPPVKWPCCLIDISNITYVDVGIDRYKTPQNRQEGSCSITLTIANQKLANTSFRAPQGQKDDAWSILGIIEQVHAKIHGFAPADESGRFLRRSFRKIKRDDGIQQFEIVYSIKLQNL